MGFPGGGGSAPSAPWAPPPALHTETRMLAQHAITRQETAQEGRLPATRARGTGDAPRPHPSHHRPQEPQVSCSGITIT